MKNISTDKPILLFDGVCNLCNRSIQFIIQRDPESKIRFAALQSDVGQYFIKKHHLQTDELKTIILIERERYYTRSTAALRVARYMNRAWPLAYGFLIVPPFIRNSVYNWIANNRYRWFGKQESCWLPTPDLKARFLN